MNNRTRLIAAVAAVVLGTASAEAATISATTSTGSPAYGTALPAGVAWIAGSVPTTVTGTIVGHYVPPFGDATTPYFTVGSPGLAPSPAELALATATDTFKLLWGTVDTWNAIDFLDSATGGFERVTGSDLLSLMGVAPGGTGARVSIKTGISFDTVVFVSDYGLKKDQPAFEFALVHVPLPATGLALVLAVGGLAAVARRRSV